MRMREKGEKKLRAVTGKLTKIEYVVFLCEISQHSKFRYTN